MSNHHHVVLTDVRGELPNFLRELHRSTAKALNVCQGQVENLWAVQQTNAVELVTAEDIVDKIAYVVANPVRARLVARPEDWPGVLLWGDSVQEATRPNHYFRAAGSTASAPLRIPLRVTLPMLRDGSGWPRDEWERRLAAAIADRLAKVRSENSADGSPFMGAEAVQARSPLSRARTSGHKPRNRQVPRIAAKDPAMRRAAILSHRAFHRDYSAALARWRAGDRQVEFPSGTWWMRVHHGARVPPWAAPIAA